MCISTIYAVYLTVTIVGLRRTDTACRWLPSEARLESLQVNDNTAAAALNFSYYDHGSPCRAVYNTSTQIMKKGRQW